MLRTHQEVYCFVIPVHVLLPLISFPQRAVAAMAVSLSNIAYVDARLKVRFPVRCGLLCTPSHTFFQTKGTFEFSESGIKWTAGIGEGSVKIPADQITALNWTALTKGFQLEVVGNGTIARFRNFNVEGGQSIKNQAAELGKTVENVRELLNSQNLGRKQLLIVAPFGMCRCRWERAGGTGEKLIFERTAFLSTKLETNPFSISPLRRLHKLWFKERIRFVPHLC